MDSGPKNILSRLNIHASPRSIDFVERKKQFQLHDLLTEQRHSRTWELSSTIKKNISAGLEQIFAVDKDITDRFEKLNATPTCLEQAAAAVGRAILAGNKIFVYGCGATGRLAKQMESTFWRPFWKSLRISPLWAKLRASVPENIAELLVGEMTGGDRALISALEGFEDLSLMGELQLQDHGVKKGDIVFCITEGGETSSVIGAVLAAAELNKDLSEASSNVYFLYNNPDDKIRPFKRSREVLENPAITRIELTTGPQALAGSTRMQATTSETYVMGLILEFGIRSVLQEFFSPEDLTELGFAPDKSLPDRLQDFKYIRAAIFNACPAIAAFSALETETYRQEKKATYLADQALITVFIDCAERSPTFHLYPLDTVKEKKRKCWLQIWTRGRDGRAAWRHFLGRDFRGLAKDLYEPSFLRLQGDEYLKAAALASLAQAGSDQEGLYDFSWHQADLEERRPKPNDLGVLVCVDDEVAALAQPDSIFSRFVKLCRKKKAKLALLLIGDYKPDQVDRLADELFLDKDKDVIIPIYLERMGDPLGLNRQILLKILLNAHSTAVMAGLRKVVGNTMTNVSPSNLKLIGRATYLIQSHVNDAVRIADQISYAEANAVLFDTLEYTAAHDTAVSEVDLAVVRIVKMLRENKLVSLAEAHKIVAATGLDNYLSCFRKDRQQDGI